MADYTQDIKFTLERTFRQTEGVHFADLNVPGSNGLDLVEHFGPSISPPSVGRRKAWYVHQHQTDNNRVIHGRRLFELFSWDFVWHHYFVMLTPETGALEIPIGCLHRSYSGTEGSLLLNQAVRTPEYDENTEFNPVSPRWIGLYPARYVNCTEKEAYQFIARR